MEQGRFTSANICLVSQKIPRPLWNARDHYHHWTISFASWIQSIRSRNISLRYIQYCTRLHLGISSSLLLSVIYNQILYSVSQDGRSIFWEVIVLFITRRNVYINMCSIPNRFRNRAIWMYNCKIVDKKEILRTVSNIYCSSNKFVGL
jgi:hypothetical protein